MCPARDSCCCPAPPEATAGWLQGVDGNHSHQRGMWGTAARAATRCFLVREGHNNARRCCDLRLSASPLRYGPRGRDGARGQLLKDGGKTCVANTMADLPARGGRGSLKAERRLAPGAHHTDVVLAPHRLAGLAHQRSGRGYTPAGGADQLPTTGVLNTADRACGERCHTRSPLENDGIRIRSPGRWRMGGDVSMVWALAPNVGEGSMGGTQRHSVGLCLSSCARCVA